MTTLEVCQDEWVHEVTKNKPSPPL